MQDLLAQMVEVSKDTSKEVLERELSIDEQHHGQQNGAPRPAAIRGGPRTAVRRFLSTHSTTSRDRAQSRDSGQLRLDSPLHNYKNPVLPEATSSFDVEAPAQQEAARE